MIRPVTTGLLLDWLRRRLRARVWIADRAAWLLPVRFDPERERFRCVRSTDDESTVLDVVPTGHRDVRAAATAAHIAVAPLELRCGEQILARRFGHNGIAEAAILLCEPTTPVSFVYQKPGSVREERRLWCTWAAGDKFGGLDRDRGDGDRRTFLLGRVTAIGPSAEAITLPVWTGESYSAGLPAADDGVSARKHP